MEDISLHVLDVAENGLRAGARKIVIKITEDLSANMLEVEVEDDGKGMDPEMAAKAMDPFFTTRDTRKVGLGLALLRDAAELAGGKMTIASGPGKGTKVIATFQHDHIDRKPIGDMGSTIVGILMGSSEVDVIYEHRVDGKEFRLDTRELREELHPVSLGSPEVLQWVRSYVNQGLKEIGASIY